MRRIPRHQFQQKISPAPYHVALPYFRPARHQRLERLQHALLLALQPDNHEKHDLPPQTLRLQRGERVALMLPGGVGNADALRLDTDAVGFVRNFFGQHKPVGVICHGAWILADTDVLAGRRLTSFPSLQTDLRNAGATWVDEEVVVDQGLVSSRTPDDLPAFNAKLVEEMGEGKNEGQTA